MVQNAQAVKPECFGNYPDTNKNCKDCTWWFTCLQESEISVREELEYGG